MSRKNHEIVDGRLLQTDKRFSALKNKQKEKISGWFFAEYSKIYEQEGLPPDSRLDSQILDAVYSKIEEAQIWIPFYEIEKYYDSHKNKFRKRYERNRISKKSDGCDKNIDLDALRADIGQINGIDEARLNEIMEVITKHLNGTVNDDNLKEDAENAEQ